MSDGQPESMEERDRSQFLRAMRIPWPDYAKDTTRIWAFGVPLSLLVTTTFPVHEEDCIRRLFAQVGRRGVFDSDGGDDGS